MNCLPKNCCAQPRLNPVGKHEVNWPLEEFFKEELQVHVRVEGFLLKLDYKIQIALRRVFAASGGTKQTQTSHAEASDLRLVRAQGVEDFFLGVVHLHSQLSALLYTTSRWLTIITYRASF